MQKIFGNRFAHFTHFTHFIHLGVILLAGYIFFRYLLGFFAPFVVGLGLALLMEPLVRFLTQKGGFKRGLASFVALLILVLAAAGIGRWGVMALYQEILEFIEAAPIYITTVQEWLAPYSFLPVAGILERAGEWIGSQSLRMVGHVPGMLIGVLLILVSAFFFSRDKSMIFDFVKKWCPHWLAQYVNPVGERLHRASWGLLKTECILVTMVAIICITVLWMMGQPYVIMLGLAIALLDSLPIVGAGLILWPWAGYLAFNGFSPQAAGLLILYAIITVIRNVIGPRILGDQIDMHPLAAIMAIFMGIKAFGPTGILVGPAMVIVAQAILKDEM